MPMLSDMIPTEPPMVRLGPYEVPLCRLTLSDWAAAEAEFGSLDAFTDAFNGSGVMRATMFVLYRLIRKRHPEVTLEAVGDAIDDLQQAISIVTKVLEQSVPAEWREVSDRPKGERPTESALAGTP
ncbi:MAG: hypothetical protein NZ959_10380 [Armatimonadetes bacterium]|nr:hypothetical protein [Armatimonadota bacterium]